MKIYDFEGFPNPARVRIALRELGLFDEVEFVPINVPEGEHQTSEFKKMNPSAAVPVLELECGTTISECTAITEYLDQLGGEPKLTGKTPKDRAVITMMQRRSEAGLLDAVGSYFHHATEGLGPDIEGYQNKAWGENQRERAVLTMHYLDDVLSEQTFIAGDQFSVADITAFAGLGFAEYVGMDIPAKCANLHRWKEEVSKRPSIAI